RTRSLHVHSLRDGRLRDGRPRLGRRLSRCVLRRRAPQRPGDGRRPRPHRAGQPLLARPLAAPDPRRRRDDGRALRQLAGRRSVTKHRGVAPLAVGLILLVDRRIWTDNIPLPIKAAADESAHIATTLCLLSLIRPKRPRDFFAGAIVGSVALDVDHLPLYAMYEKPSARPGSHSLVTGRACRGPHRTKHRTEKRVPARSVVRAREPSLPRPLDRWCAPLLAAVRTEGDDRRFGAPLAPTPEQSRRSANTGRQLRHTVVVTQAVAWSAPSCRSASGTQRGKPLGSYHIDRKFLRAYCASRRRTSQPSGPPIDTL